MPQQAPIHAVTIRGAEVDMVFAQLSTYFMTNTVMQLISTASRPFSSITETLHIMEFHNIDRQIIKMSGEAIKSFLCELRTLWILN